jgi:WD40 repeat protein
MGGLTSGEDPSEIGRMQASVRAWVLRAASASVRGLRGIPPPMLLSLLCASAFSPLLPVAAGLGAAAIAGSTVLSSISGGALSGIVASALDRARSKGGPHEPASAGLQEQIAEEISRVLTAGDASAQALRAEIATVLQGIDAGAVMVRAAMEEGDERVRRDVIAAIEVLGSDFAEMRFLITDVALAAAQIQESLDVQSADIRAIIEQNQRQSADIRLVRDNVAAVARRAGVGGLAITGGNGAGPRWANGCPYRGLLPFEETDAEIFYGRERLTAELAVTLAAQPSRGGIVVVTGASGAGKSSLLRAGLLPKLAQGQQVAGSEHWPRIVMTPTKDPLTELGARLAALGGGSTRAVREELASHPGQAHLAVRTAVLADAIRRNGGQPSSDASAIRLVLIVDQFEQVFTLDPGPGGEAERKAFISVLRTAATRPVGTRQEPSAIVVIAVRGDFWDRCAAYPELADALQEGQFVVGPMTESDLRLAIIGPADSARLRIDPALTDTILGDLRVAGGDVGTGVLPLLSQAMALTWDLRDGDQLTSHGYGQSGGVTRAVQVSADNVYDSLPAGQQALAGELLRSMTVTSYGGRLTRRPVTRADLYAGHPDADPGQVDAVLEAFADRRLIVLNNDTAQIAHDVLLSAWPRLREWLEEDQASWILHGQFADDAIAWHDNHGDPSFLYRGTQLTTLQEAAGRWAASPGRYPALTTHQRDFLRASLRAGSHSARRRRGTMIILAMLTVAALIASVLAVQQRNSELRQRDDAIYNEITAEALQVSATNTSLAAQLTLAAYRMRPTQDLASQLLSMENTPLSIPLTTGSSGPILSVVFSPDRRTMASAGTSGGIQLWNVANPANPRPLGQPLTATHDSGFSSMAFSPDGRTLAGIDGSAIKFWNVANPAAPRPLGQALTSNNVFLDSLAFSPAGRTLAAYGASASNTPSTNRGIIQLWNVADPADPRPLGQALTSIDEFFIGAVKFSPDGRTLAVHNPGPDNGTIQLWNVANPADPRPLGHPLTAANDSGIDATAFSSGGHIMASGDNNGTIQLWNVANPANPRPLGQPLTSSNDGPVSSMAFSPNGRTLSSDNDGTVQLWNLADPTHPGLLGQSLSTDGGVDAVAFSPDGSVLATGDGNGTIQLWNIPQTVIASSGSAIGSVAFSPDKRTLASVENSDTVQLWNVADPARPYPVGPPLTGGSGTGIESVSFSSDSRTLAAYEVSSNGLAYVTVQLWDVADPAHPYPSGHPLTDANNDGIFSVAFSPNYHTMATGDLNGLIQLWSVADPAHPHPAHQTLISGNDSNIDTMAFSPDGRILASVDDSGDIDLWNVADPATDLTLGSSATASGIGARSVTFSPDGRTLALLTEDGTIKLWNVADPANPRGLGQLPTVTTGQVDSIAFNPDGTLASGDYDGTIQLWNMANPAHPQPRGQPLTGSTTAITSVAFSPDGTLATSNSGGTTLLWNLNIGYAIKWICTAARDNLNPQRWAHYIQLPYQSPCGQ